MPGLTFPARDLIERRRVLGRFAGECQGLTATGDSARCHAMHVQIAFDLAPLFREQHGEEETRAKQLAQPREQASSRTGPKRPNGASVLSEKSGPDLDVPIFDL